MKWFISSGKRIFWGVFFIAAAVFILAMQFTGFTDIGFWSIAAAVFLLAVLVQSIVKANFFGIFLPAVCLYAIFQKPLDWPQASFWMLLLAACIVSIGFSMIFSHKKIFFNKRPHINVHVSSKNGEKKEYSGEAFRGTTVEHDADDFPRAEVNFSESIQYLQGQAIQSGRFEVNFGHLELHFEEAGLAPEGAEIVLECSFGSIDIYVPKGWRIINNTNATLSGIDIPSSAHAGEDGSPRLYLKGNVQLGSVATHYR